MTDPRMVLDQVTDRAEAWLTVDMHSDVLTLVAALQAVLDITDGQHEYTCESSWLVGQIRNAITEALGGSQ